VAFPIQSSPQILATGGFEKKLRIFDLTRSGGSNSSSPTSPSAVENGNGPSAITSYEIGPGVHGGTIKSIVWNQDYNILTTAAEDRKIRWWDLRSRHPVVEYAVEGTIGSCELNTLATRPNDPGILTVAAGKSVYLFDGVSPGRLLKKMDFRYEVASAAVNNDTGRLVTGSADDTWARVYDLRTEEELGMCIRTSHLLSSMGHANLLFQRFKKVTTAPSGQSVSLPMANSTALEVRMEQSSSGRHAGSPMDCGGRYRDSCVYGNVSQPTVALARRSLCSILAIHKSHPGLATSMLAASAVDTQHSNRGPVEYLPLQKQTPSHW
jgi:serine-threonine kinase receptor-associated protein